MDGLNVGRWTTCTLSGSLANVAMLVNEPPAAGAPSFVNASTTSNGVTAPASAVTRRQSDSSPVIGSTSTSSLFTRNGQMNYVTSSAVIVISLSR